MNQMQFNYVIIGIESQGVKEFVNLLIDLLYFNGVKVSGAVLSSRTSELGLGLEIGFVRTGEGIVSPIINEKNADAIFVLDGNLLSVGTKYVKSDHGIVLTTSYFHNISKSTGIVFHDVLRKTPENAPNIYVIEIVDLMNNLNLLDTDEFKKWTVFFCLISMAVKLGIIPIKLDSYLASLQSILNDEDLIRLNKKVLSEIHKYVWKVEG